MQKNDGFSLIELLIAIFFISIVLVAIASGMVKVAQALWETKARSIAVNMAQNCIEDINFANKYTSWYNFFNDTNDVITGSCLEETMGLINATFDPASVGIVEKDEDYLLQSNEVTLQEPLESMKREFTDESIQTKFNFLVEVHRATQSYARAGACSVSNPLCVKSQVVVVMMTVTWDKYYSTGSVPQRNTYTVTKQYLQPSTY